MTRTSTVESISRKNPRFLCRIAALKAIDCRGSTCHGTCSRPDQRHRLNHGPRAAFPRRCRSASCAHRGESEHDHARDARLHGRWLSTPLSVLPGKAVVERLLGTRAPRGEGSRSSRQRLVRGRASPLDVSHRRDVDAEKTPRQPPQRRPDPSHLVGSVYPPSSLSA